ncbi:multidrug transporter [Halorussus marinus]|uniref:multidrug transporter n=1 Tax=Halorussus marinus TaxID=2505976 RepID=UPI00106E20F8|nr:multidrug transporter [Halorussus marinus]
MLPARDTSSIGTLVGLVVAVIAIGGSVLFGWEWGSFLRQPVPLAIGVIAAIVAVAVTLGLGRD